MHILRYFCRQSELESCTSMEHFDEETREIVITSNELKLLVSERNYLCIAQLIEYFFLILRQ